MRANHLDRFPHLPEDGNFNRRAHSLWPLLNAFLCHLTAQVDTLPAIPDISALPVVKPGRAIRRRFFWYDHYAYPLVRLVRILMGQGARYPRDPRAIIPANLDVHVNEQSLVSLWRVLRQVGFRARVWLDTPPQNRHEGWVFRIARHVLFNWPPFCWFFEREVFAVAQVDGV